MTGDLVYEFGSSPGSIDLTSPDAMLQSPSSLRSSEWAFDLGNRGIRSAARKASTRKAVVFFRSRGALDDALARFAVDVEGDMPGTITAEHGWQQRALVLASEPGVGGGSIAVSLTVALLDGVWRRWLEPVELVVRDNSGQAEPWLGYPHPYPHGWARGRQAAGVDVRTACGCACRLTFWGPCADPYVAIGANVYSVRGLRLASGERCVLDGTAYAATRVAVDGTETDVTALAQRGAGEGCGTYAFERVRPGWQPIAWDGSFGVTIELCEERGEPTWAS